MAPPCRRQRIVSGKCCRCGLSMVRPVNQTRQGPPARVGGAHLLGSWHPGQVAEAVCGTMHVAHELTPTQHLPHKALDTRERCRALHCRLDHSHRQQTRHIQQVCNARMKQGARGARHGVLIRTKMFETFAQGEVPALMSMGFRCRERAQIHAAWMCAKLRAHQHLHFGLQSPVLKARNSRSRRRARPRLAVLAIKAETPA